MHFYRLVIAVESIKKVLTLMRLPIHAELGKYLITVAGNTSHCLSYQFFTFAEAVDRCCVNACNTQVVRGTNGAKSIFFLSASPKPATDRPCSECKWCYFDG